VLLRQPDGTPRRLSLPEIGAVISKKQAPAKPSEPSPSGQAPVPPPPAPDGPPGPRR
jgi:hypothetical protein